MGRGPNLIGLAQEHSFGTKQGCNGMCTPARGGRAVDRAGKINSRCGVFKYKSHICDACKSLGRQVFLRYVSESGTFRNTKDSKLAIHRPNKPTLFYSPLSKSTGRPNAIQLSLTGIKSPAAQNSSDHNELLQSQAPDGMREANCFDFIG